jgi:hypothetical protein
MIRPIRNNLLPVPTPAVRNRDQQASHAAADTVTIESPADQARSATAPIHRDIPARYRALRPDAAFVAQLIATAQGLPQTCARRRADPRQAAQAYSCVYGEASGAVPRAQANHAAPVAA